MKILHFNDAIKLGYVAMTRSYRINSSDKDVAERETKWFRSVLRDMRGADFVVVEFNGGPEVWRHKRELNVDPSTGKTVGSGSNAANMKGVRSFIRAISPRSNDNMEARDS